MSSLKITKVASGVNIAGGGGIVTLNNQPLAVLPIGSIIETTSTISPAQLYGGTWEEFGKGKVLVGRDTSDSDFNTILKTGGEKTHTLSVEEMPSHGHCLSDFNLVTTAYSGTTGWPVSASGTAEITGGIILPKNTYNTGGGQSHNNLQPYIVVYRWRRIA